MNCVEFERNLSEFMEGSHTPDQQAHLNSCPVCASLLAELHLLTSQAETLSAADEPSPALWYSIEAQLRAEGLIRDPQVKPTRVKRSFLPKWRMAWAVPVAAALALVAGIKLYHPAGVGEHELIVQKNAPATPAPVTPVSKEDQQLINTVAARIPAQQARYRADLDDANAFIRDAEQSLKDDPNDVYTQQMLINAYAQKQMLYDLAVDRSEQ